MVEQQNTHLRNLKIDDAPLMLEWMHDDSVVQDLHADFAHKTLTDCEKFIREAQDGTNNLHLAVADSSDTYMGTVSLKDINLGNRSAEFAITMRKAAMGKGYAAEGMKTIMDYGFNKMKLNSIYWCVDPANHRALKFYDKNGYERISMNDLCNELKTSKTILIRGGGYEPEEAEKYIWYLVSRTSRNTEK